MLAALLRPGAGRLGLLLGGGLVLVAGLTWFGGGLSLPALFMSGAAVMLMLGLAAFWQSIRSALGEAEGLGWSSAEAVLPERTALLEEKRTLLRAIKDVRYEHELGKIRDDDFARLDRAYRLRAKEVLRLLDQVLGPSLERAEALVVEALEKKAPRKKRRKKAGPTCSECGTTNDRDAKHCKECGSAVGRRICTACDTENDADAKFCKGCATPLASGSGSEPVRTPGAKADDPDTTDAERAVDSTEGAPAVAADQPTSEEE